jgi:Leucine-rich repeat (LRR) protein
VVIGVFYFFRLCFTLLGIVWSDGKLELKCNEQNCVFHNVHILNFTGYLTESNERDLKSAKTLTFQNSRFKHFPKPIAKHFIALEELRATDCNMAELGGNFKLYFSNGKNNHLLKLDKVDFSRNELLKVEEFARLPNLKHLNLSSNLIGELQNENFSGLSQLKVLDLGSNHISQIAPETFSTLYNLETVILANNKLTQLPERVFSTQSHLIEIDLAHNNLIKFDFGAIGSTWKLERINLAQNSMTSLQNLITRPKEQTTIITINITDNKWNCFYAQQLELEANMFNYKLIGNDCPTNWLDATNEKLQTQLDEQSNIVTELKIEIDHLKLEMAKLLHLEKNVISIPWIIGIILTVNMIFIAIDGNLAVVFMRNLFNRE